MVNALFFRRAGKEFHGAGPEQESCRMLKVDILGRQDRRESLSAVDGALRCCASAGTVQTSMGVPCRADTCRHDTKSERDTLRGVQPM